MQPLFSWNRPQRNSIGGQGALPHPPLKLLLLINARIAKERGPGEGSAPSEGTGGQSLRTRELCWETEIAPTMSDGAQRFYYYNNLLKSLPPQQLQVKLTVGEQILDFLVNTGVTYSGVNRPLTKSLWQAVTITGISGNPSKANFS